MSEQDIDRDGHALFRLSCILILVLIYLAGEEVFGIGMGNAFLLGGDSYRWFAGIIGYLLIGFGIAGICVWGIAAPDGLIAWYDRNLAPQILKLRWGRGVLAAAVLVVPSILLLGIWGKSLTTPAFRFLLLCLTAVIAGMLQAGQSRNGLPRIALSLLIGASIYGVAKRLVLVTDYPFKLYWSEGNRLWDYSLYFLRNQYIVEGEFVFPTYLTPGRHALWGLPFLIPGVNIATLRLWDVVLWTVPYFLLGWLLFAPKRVAISRLLRVGISLWTVLFLTQGGIFAPLVLSAALLAWGLDPNRPARAAVLVAIAGFYAGISRWTWFAAPAVWAGLWILLDLEAESSRSRRLIRGLGVGIAGLIAGLASQAFLAAAFPRPDAVFSTALSQPLLWYRLLPNVLNSEGILRGILIAAGPLVVLMIWGSRKGRLRWGWLEWLALGGALAGFLGIGLAASVKIGGGNNLHNLDMFMITLLLALAWVAIRWLGRKGKSWSSIPGGIQALVVIAVLIPSFEVMRSGHPTRLPDPEAISESLSIIQTETALADQVLFIDQRQLFTFGQIENEPLITNYELKDLMNQAMSSNQAFFDKFEADLEARRFDLIVSDALPQFLKGSNYEFGEESDAYFHFVAGPLNDSYVPYRRLPVGVWLLAPRPVD